MKFKQYRNYEIYGADGFDVFFQPSPLVILFNNRDIKINKVTIDNTEIIEIKSLKKGRYIFEKSGLFKGFGDFAGIFGLVVFFLQGLGSFPGPKSLSIFSSKKQVVKYLFIRLGLFLGVWLPVYILALGLPMVMGIRFSLYEVSVYALFVFYTLLVLAFFFYCGAAVDIFLLRRKEGTRKIAAYVFFILLIIIPEVADTILSMHVKHIRSLENVNIEKFSNLMEFQKRSMGEIREKLKDPSASPLDIKREIASRFFNEVYLENEVLENALFEETKKAAAYDEAVSALLVTDFYSFLMAETSSCGYYDYMRFFQFIVSTRRAFEEFIISKRNFKRQERVERFFKTGEGNVFKGQGHFPRWGWFSCLLLVLGIGFLNLIIRRNIYFLLYEGGKVPSLSEYDFEKIQEGSIYYVFFGNSIDRDNCYRSLRGKENIHLEQIGSSDFDRDIKIIDYINFHISLSKLNRERVFFYMDCLDVERDIFQKRIGAIEFEIFKRIYCALTLSGDLPYILINDYVRDVSYDFKDSFKHLLLTIKKRENKTVLYLGKEMFKTAAEHEQEQQVSESTLYKIFDIGNIESIML